MKVKNGGSMPSPQFDVTKALEIARSAHEGQFDQGGVPYFEHVRRVSAGAQRYAERLNLSNAVTLAGIVGALHDMIEDTEYDEESLFAAGIPTRAIQAITLLTHLRCDARPDYLEQLGLDPIACAVKLADNDDNTDPIRIETLDEPTATRLRAKYARDREILERHWIRHTQK